MAKISLVKCTKLSNNNKSRATAKRHIISKTSVRWLYQSYHRRRI